MKDQKTVPLLEDIALGLGDIAPDTAPKNERLVSVKPNTLKVRNSVLRKIIGDSINKNKNLKDIINTLLLIDEAVENNKVKEILIKYGSCED